MLKLSGVSASYGSVPAIGNVNIEIGEGEAVGLLGANGAGKSTSLRVISGLVRLTSGTITFAGTNLASLPPHKIPELGIAHVPEGRQVFPEMTVQENLEIGAYVPKAKAEEMAQSITTAGHVALYGLFFDSGKADVKPESKDTLDQIAKLLTNTPALKLLVVGHTDNVGKSEANQKLSEDRAASVVAYLIGKGVAPERLQAVGHGDTAPISDNTSAKGREANRRVEFNIVSE